MEKYYVISFNFIYGLLLDIIIVGIVKNLTKRERPGKNPVKGLDWGPDRYSFPSGHASRAVFVALFLIDQFRIRSVHRPLCQIVQTKYHELVHNRRRKSLNIKL